MDAEVCDCRRSGCAAAGSPREMRGCSDTCAARIRRIQQAGLAKCLEMGRANGRPNPERDREIIRKSALWGYKTTAQVVGCSESCCKECVKRYEAYAELILAGRPEK